MIQHFYQNIQGWSGGIVEMYKQIIDSAPSNSFLHFVEVGTWKGTSAAFMAVEIANSGKDIQFDCVDTFEGDPNEISHVEDPSIVAGTLYDEFINNMKPVEGFYRPVRMTSLEAADCYDDKSLDFVFIDAAHDYDSIHADILAWFPKVKIGGVIAGHDFNHSPDQNGVDYGPGKAVRELFTHYVTPPYCWAVQKTDTTKLNLAQE